MTPPSERSDRDVALYIRLRVAAGVLRSGIAMERRFYTDLAATIEEAALYMEHEKPAVGWFTRRRIRLRQWLMARGYERLAWAVTP